MPRRYSVLSNDCTAQLFSVYTDENASCATKDKAYENAQFLTQIISCDVLQVHCVAVESLQVKSIYLKSLRSSDQISLTMPCSPWQALSAKSFACGTATHPQILLSCLHEAPPLRLHQQVTQQPSGLHIHHFRLPRSAFYTGHVMLPSPKSFIGRFYHKTQ